MATYTTSPNIHAIEYYWNYYSNWINILNTPTLVKLQNDFDATYPSTVTEITGTGFTPGGALTNGTVTSVSQWTAGGSTGGGTLLQSITDLPSTVKLQTIYDSIVYAEYLGE